MKSRDLDLLDILLIIAKNKKIVIIITLLFSVFAVVYIVLYPVHWKATATFFPSQTNDNKLSLGSSLVGLSTSLLGGAGSTQGLELITIMRSKVFSEDVINRFNLVDYFKISEDNAFKEKDIAIRLLKERVLDLGIDDETGLVYITAETKDKHLSKDIANYYLEKIEQYNINNRMSKGKRNRVFLEGRVNEVERKIEKITEKILTFQQENNAISLEDQTNSAISLYTELVSAVMQKEIQLALVSDKNEKNPLVKQIQEELKLLRSRIIELETSESEFSYILGLNSVSEDAMSLEKMKIELEIQKSLYEFLIPQYEQAKIEEIKDIPTIEVIDHATLAGLRSKPKRAIFCIMVFIGALILSICVVLVIGLLDAEQKEKLRLLWKLALSK